ALVFFLVDFGGAGNYGKDGGFGYFLGMHAQLGEGFAQALGMNCSGGQGPSFFSRGRFSRRDGVGIQVGNRDAVDGLGGMAGEPSEDVSFVAALGENIPDGFDFARGAGDGTHTAALRIGLDETENSMLVGAHAG